MKIFNIFKGTKNQQGKVVPIRMIGHGYYEENSELCELKINGLSKDSYSLTTLREKDKEYDFEIQYEDLGSEDLERVGVGYLMDGKNRGLIRLEWDLFDSKNIYINLSEVSFSELLTTSA